MTATACRFCGAPVSDVFADLGMSPLANSYLPPESVNSMEPFYPLRALVCAKCFLVQLEEFETPEQIFSDYAYFSSYSSSWLDHSRRYAEQMIERLGLDGDSQVVEIASNDGYLLQYFADREISVLGIEPAANVAEVAVEKGIPTVVEFFGEKVAAELAPQSAADLLLGNNVLAHVPDLNDFVAGMRVLLKPGGVITMEFPHLMRLVEDNQWDTIYHEHFSYFSFLTVSAVFAAHGLRVFDVQELPTHGGSLRIYAAHAEDTEKRETDAARELAERERAAGYERLDTYLGYGRRVEQDKRQILRFLIDLKEQDLNVVGYGAPAKGNTLLNYCGVRREFIDYTCDLNPHKQGHFLPGSHIPIRSPEQIRADKPDVVLILPWNLKDEIMEQLGFIREWGGRFAARTPELTLLS
ncbi:MAG TPA: class I SAM-dependent methyltransferase [Solirubrobacteraceae bacterium]|jgi:SAM-dependent methyltransferase|nr:class I SAM-dependent methyltransferase [Solirubrobacteraceae bacterium]